MQIYKAIPGLVIADTPYVYAAIGQLSAKESFEACYPDSDVAYLFMEGKVELISSISKNQSELLLAPMQAFIPAGSPYLIKNTTTEAVNFIWAVAPGPKSTPAQEERKDISTPATPEAVTIMDTSSGKRFPKSPRMRGGMLYFEPGFECAYHSHDAAEEVFLFLQGRCEITVEGEVEEVGVGEIVFVPADHKHKLKALGKEPLVMWLTVTPNREKSHTF